MAFSWIRVDVNLRHHPKAIALACEIGDTRAHTYLVDLWSWASQHTPSGHIKGKNLAAVVEGACGWTGERGLLFRALVDSGWLDTTADGVEIHQWFEHAGAHVLKAEKDAQKKRERRETALNVRCLSPESPSNGAECPTDGARREADGAQTALDGARPSTSLSQLVGSASSSGGSGGSVPPDVAPPGTESGAWTGEDFWRWAQHKRREAGLVPERPPKPEAVNSWWSAVRMAVQDVEALKEAFYRFGEEPYWQRKKPPLPFAGFKSQWEKYMPQMEVRRAGS